MRANFYFKKIFKRVVVLQRSGFERCEVPLQTGARLSSDYNQAAYPPFKSFSFSANALRM